MMPSQTTPFNNKRLEIISLLKKLDISYQEIEHPPLPTAEEARKYWEGHAASFCRNLFFRNHKGKQHYLVILENRVHFDIRGLEKRLGQGKLSLASEWRLVRYLGVTPGNVSIFSILYDHGKHVKIFLDQSLKNETRLGFHPNDNRYTLIVSREDVEKFMDHQGNAWEYIQLGGDGQMEV